MKIEDPAIELKPVQKTIFNKYSSALAADQIIGPGIL